MIGIGLDKFFEDITIQRATASTDDWGHPLYTYADHHTVRGRLRPLSAKEVYASNKIAPQGTYRLYTRSSDVLPTDRISYGGKVFEITGIYDPMFFGWFYQVECTEYEVNG
jgi:SPP1 family predicted phage head-tail adaptor